MNSQLWATGREEDKEIARSRKRKLHYVSNILVVSDSANPENEGKVFKYQYGKKIFDKIMDVMQPQFEDEEPINVFDFWEGANFKLKIRKVEGYRNYDKSEFDSASALLDGDDKKLEAVYNSMHDIGEYVDPKSYKSYADLKKKLYSVLGEEITENLSADSIADLDRSTDASVGNSDDADDIPMGDTATEDDDLGYFAKLAKDDD